jgi:hypothetical protein
MPRNRKVVNEKKRVGCAPVVADQSLNTKASGHCHRYLGRLELVPVFGTFQILHRR